MTLLNTMPLLSPNTRGCTPFTIPSIAGILLDGNITYVAGLTGSLLSKVLHSFGIVYLSNIRANGSSHRSNMLETVQANIATELEHQISLRHQIFRFSTVEWI